MIFDYVMNLPLFGLWVEAIFRGNIGISGNGETSPLSTTNTILSIIFFFKLILILVYFCWFYGPCFGKSEQLKFSCSDNCKSAPALKSKAANWPLKTIPKNEKCELFCNQLLYNS